jgi:hypothetical protein
MDRFRISPLALFCCLLCDPVLAQVTVIGPSTPGVTESEMTLVATSNPGFFVPEFTPVALGSRPGGFDPTNGDIPLAPTGCLQGCFSFDNLTGLVMFDVTFSKPVSAVSVLQMGLAFGNGAEVFAYNSADLPVGHCVGNFEGPFSESVPPGCYKVTFSEGIDGALGGLGNLSITNSTPDITTILIAGTEGSPASGEAVQFGVPEPGTCSLLALSLLSLAITRRRLSQRRTNARVLR